MANIIGFLNEQQQPIILCKILHNGESYSFNAIFDTGANKSCIGEHIIAQIGIASIGTQLQGNTDNVISVNTHIVTIKLAQDIVFPDIEVISSNLPGIDALIGMDIISQGDFHIYHLTDGRITFSFDVPPYYSVP
mgnify:CR=1 FL=1